MNLSHNEGNTASLICQADGEPLPNIIWYFNSTPLYQINTLKYTFTGGYLVNSRSIVYVLIIMNVQLSDVGTYTCNATNVVSSDTSSAVLTINGELLLCSYNYSFY